MININYSSLKFEAKNYWEWSLKNKITRIPSKVAEEGAGSEFRTPLMHFGTVLPVYLSVIRYLKILKPGKGFKLIELGSGTGRVLSYIKREFPELEVWGVDYSEYCIEYAKKIYGNYGVKFVCTKGQNTFLPKSSFDFVISSHVIEHIPKKDGLKFIKEVYRLLKKDGYGFIGTPERRMCQELYMKNPDDNPAYRLILPHEHEYTIFELKRLAQQIFPEKNVRVDQLSNNTFHKIFSSSIDRFKPNGNRLNILMSKIYKVISKLFPKPLFDSVTKIAVAINMKIQGLSYRDILYNNKIGKEKDTQLADNLLLVCKK